jgi:hypothetical protein
LGLQLFFLRRVQARRSEDVRALRAERPVQAAPKVKRKLEN